MRLLLLLSLSLAALITPSAALRLLPKDRLKPSTGVFPHNNPLRKDPSPSDNDYVWSKNPLPNPRPPPAVVPAKPAYVGAVDGDGNAIDPEDLPLPPKGAGKTVGQVGGYGGFPQPPSNVPNTFPAPAVPSDAYPALE